MNGVQFYLDAEQFMGGGVSGATGLGGLSNGDVVREGAAGLKRTFYIARAFVRLMLPCAELPLADEGETGLFLRAGWNDGATETFAFTEVDRQAGAGAPVSGVHWRGANDRAGVAAVIEGLSGPHEGYLAAGGSGFLLG